MTRSPRAALRAGLPPLVAPLLALACVSPPPTSATGITGGPVGAPRSIEELERLHQPGPKHRALDAFVGEWDISLEGPEQSGGPLVPAGSGSATIGWTLDGRFLEMRANFDFAGKQLETLGFVGYDNSIDLYQGIWFADANTGMTLMNGKGDPRRAGIVLQPMRRGISARKRMRILDDATLQIDVVGTDARGGEVVVRRATYRRR